MLNHAQQLTRKLAHLVPDITAGDYRPTDQVAEVFQVLAQKIDAEVAAFDELVDGDLAEFNAMLHQYQIKAIG